MTSEPSVLLVVLDAVRADALEPYGCSLPSSPYLKEFAASATTCERVISTSCWTLPAHASLFTGLPATEHRLGAGRWSLVEVDGPTTAESLRARGLRTVGASANPWIGRSFGFDRGFDTFIEGWRPAAMPDVTAEALRTGTHHRGAELRRIVAAGPAAVAGAVPAAASARLRARGLTSSHRLAERFCRAFAAAAATGPVFGFLNLLDAHLPRRPAGRDRASVGAPRCAAPHPWEYAGGLAAPVPREPLWRCYLAAVHAADRRLQQVVAAVERSSPRPLRVIVTADHGENICDHGLLDHQFSLHQTLLHVPLLVREPAGGRAHRDTALRSLADVHQLALGEEPPGRNRADAWYPQPQPPVGRLRARYPRGSFDVLDRELRAVAHDDGRKLIWASDGRHEAYDLRDDPDERRNLWPQERFRAELDSGLGYL